MWASRRFALAVLLLLIVAAPSWAAVNVYGDLASWQAAVGGSPTYLPFGDYATNTQITTQYQPKGVTFSGSPNAPYAITNYYGQSYLLNNKLWVSDPTSTMVVDFSDPLSALAMDLRGSQGDTAYLYLYSGSSKVWQGAIPPAAFDDKVWSFFGFKGSAGTTFTRAVVNQGTGSLTGCSLDNLRFLETTQAAPGLPAVALVGVAPIVGAVIRRRARRR
jgi:hypothetical protein